MNSLAKIILIFLLLADISSAQKINFNGKVIDIINNDGVSFATVFLSNDKDTIGICADIEGEFHFKNTEPGFYQIRIKSSGYENFVGKILVDTSLRLQVFKMKGNIIIDSVYIFSFNKLSALSDIEIKNMRLLLPGGFVSSKIYDSDTLFEKKYKIKFYSRDCIIYCGENEEEYNQQIFNYLDKKYGLRWREEVRKDVIGFIK